MTAGPSGGRAQAATERGRQTRARLLAAAAEVVGSSGAGATSVGAIAERAGVSAGALYRHFTGKEELLAELFASVAEGELAAMHAAGDETKVYVERLDAVLETYASRALSNRRLAWALLYEPVGPELDADRLAYRRRYAAQMTELLELAIAAGELPEQDAGLSAAAIVGVMSEALVGPLSPAESSRSRDGEELTAAAIAMCRRIVGAGGFQTP